MATPNRDAVAYFTRERRRGREAYSDFRFLIDTPHEFGVFPVDTLSNALQLPGALFFGMGVAYTEATNTGDIKIAVVGQPDEISVRGTSNPNEIVVVPVTFEENSNIQIRFSSSGTAAGTVRLYLRDQLNRFFLFATGEPGGVLDIDGGNAAGTGEDVLDGGSSGGTGEDVYDGGGS
jgi:hypothetical protein